MPTVIGTPTAINVGQAASPGAQAITVPANAQFVVVFYGCYAPSGAALTLTSTFASFTIVEDIILNDGTAGIAYGYVTATGAQTLTPSWGTALSQGPAVIVAFFEGVHPSVPAYATFARAGNGGFSDTIASLETTPVFSLETAAIAAPPGTPSGWTSLQTQTVASSIDCAARLSRANTPGVPTTALVTQATNFARISAIALSPAPAGISFVPGIDADNKLVLTPSVVQSAGGTDAGAIPRLADDGKLDPSTYDAGMQWSTVVSANAVAADLSGYVMETGGVLRTVTLPASVPQGFRFAVQAVGGQVRINPAPHTIIDVGVGNTLLVDEGGVAMLVASAAGQLRIVAGQLQGPPGPPGAGLSDAPSDDNSYARRNGAWVEVPRFLTYLKTADQTKTNDIVWADDPDLVSETLLPNAVYRVELLLMTRADAATDLAFRVNRSGLADADIRIAGDLDNSASTVFTWLNQQNIAGAGTTALRMGNYIGYLVTGADAGSVAIQWRQQTAGAGASTLARGSMMMLRRVG